MSFQNAGDAAQAMLDRWSWWRSALKDPHQIGNTLKIHDGEPQQGYYRTRFKGGPWEPVAIFFPEDSDQIAAYRNGKEVRAEDVWLWCCRNPISYEAYEKAIAGGGFDDEPAKARGIGDNSGEADPYDALKIEFLGEKEQSEEILKKGIKTQADADKASIWKDRMLKIRSRAEALFTAEKQPWLDGGRAVDEKWRSLAHKKDGETTAMADKLRDAMEGFLKAKQRAEEERQRKAREAAAAAQREADEARIAAEKAKAAEVAKGMADAAAIAEHNRRQEEAARAAEAAAERARLAEKEAEARKVSAGRTGARTGLQKQKIGVVIDYEKAALALVRMKHADMLAEIDRLAQRAAKASMAFDGMEVREEEVVR